ncbi:hypothetical protein KCP71_08205 [Salmonella enterica subsp. enterica]|nr:hypothetical protein KCP71_08205 [Salmonella enterica subsp. enterica]
MVTVVLLPNPINAQCKVMRRSLKMIVYTIAQKREETECWILCRMRRCPGLQKQMPQDRPSASRSVCSRQARRARSVPNVREEHEHFPGQNIGQAAENKTQKASKSWLKVILKQCEQCRFQVLRRGSPECKAQ